MPVKNRTVRNVICHLCLSCMMMEEYPNLWNDALPAILPCARWQHEIVAYATRALERVCPMGFIVENVKPLPSISKPYCRWYAEFRTANYVFLPEPGEELKVLSKKLMRIKPMNSKFVSRHPVSPYAMAIIYSCDPCPCREALDFDEAVLPAKMWPTVIKGLNDCDLDICWLFEGTD